MIDWNDIDTVLLDMDGTLLDLHYDNYFWLEHLPRRYAEKNALSTEQAYARLTNQFRQQEGNLNWYCIDYWSEQLEMDIESLKREVTEKIGFRPSVEDFLQQLKARGKRSAIVTNAHRKVLNIKLEITGLDRWIDTIISSHDFSLPKEDANFWPALNNTLPFDKNSTLLIDDSLPVLRSARQFGIKHLLSIAQPDSQKPANQNTEFAALADFAHITPPLAQGVE